MSSVSFSGPLFSANVSHTVARALDRIVEDVAKDALEAVKGQLRPGHGVDKGDFENSLRISRDGHKATVSTPQTAKAAWLEGTSRRNRTSSYKGIQPFTKATRATDRTAKRTADRRAAELARDLGGA